MTQPTPAERVAEKIRKGLGNTFGIQVSLESIIDAEMADERKAARELLEFVTSIAEMTNDGEIDKRSIIKPRVSIRAEANRLLSKTRRGE